MIVATTINRISYMSLSNSPAIIRNIISLEKQKVWNGKIQQTKAIKN